MELDESRVVAAAVAGDENAFRALVEHHYDRCLRYAMRMLGDRAEAEDVVQDVFIRVYRGLRGYREQGQFGAWVFRILVNQCRSAAGRGASRRAIVVSIEETAEAELAAPAPQEAAVEPITAALAELPALLREAFVLKFVEEWSYDEMVAMTGASESALKMRVARAKDALRERLREGNDARS